MINLSIHSRLATFCPFDRLSESVNLLVGLSEVSLSMQVAPDTRNTLNVGSCVKEYIMLCFQMVNDESDFSSVISII